MKQIRRHLTYANVMSSIAVFLILGGATAMAAKVGTGQLKAGSVKTGKIAKEAVKAGKLASNAVTTPKVANAAITSEKLADGSVTTTKIANGAVTGEKVNASTLGVVPNATNAINAQVGAPAAYAQIAEGGGINAGEPSRGITSAAVTNPSIGIYCVDLAFAPKTAAGSGVSAAIEDGIVSFELGAPYPVCPEGAEAEVRFVDAGAQELQSEAVWVQFDN